MYRALFFFIPMLLFSGCRSEADKMAEFCLQYAQIVETHTDCRHLASAMTAFIEAPHPKLRDGKVCENSTACLPCRKAARDMLKSCGYAPEMRSVLDKMQFSDALREAAKPND